jgi:polyhydroxybutyrate depolymerase
MPPRSLTIPLLTVLLLTGCSSTDSRATGGEHTLTVDGRERSYRVHVPEEATGRLPMVLVLHGGGGNGEQVARQTRMSAAADEAGFVAVYPNGTGRTSLLSWNAGNCCSYAHREGVDDVAFMSTLLDEVLAEYPVDPARVYATGMSNGAMMSYRLACELSDRIAGIAPVAGALNVTPCTPSGPVAVLAVHGTADQAVPYDGGPPTRTMPGNETWTNTSVADSIGFWAAHNGCQPPTERRDGPVTVATYDGCDVVLYTVEDGGHTWPGGEQPRSAADPSPPKPDTTRVVLDFFHGLQE